ncbi:RH-like protein isoform X2 [Petaurus breviceps papuanus]|uniref:RH-like protein isoform X2 n=1 Tax=Petaurus breviceps papuanus TaxID=3040969 RepID=UPI0036DCBA72
MGSKYQKSLRISLPFWALILEIALILVFFFFTSYETPSKKLKLLKTYPAFQDINVMAVLGLGFLNASLRRYTWSGVAFNLFTLALGVQWAIILDGFQFSFFSRKIPINIQRIILGTMSAMSVLISSGAILGKVNLVQMIVMTLLEVTVFRGAMMLTLNFLDGKEYESMMQIHVFGAYFGVAVAWCLSGPELNAAKEKERRATTSSLFTTLGTLFLWIFWPTFNSALLDQPSEKETAVYNTYYALAASSVAAMSLSAATHSDGKISMECLNRTIGLHDTCEVHSTFGLPALLGGLTYIMLEIEQASWASFSGVGFQVLVLASPLSLFMAMGLVGGVLTGVILRLNLWKAPPAAKYFDDQAFWEFPHLAVGF